MEKLLKTRENWYGMKYPQIKGIHSTIHSIPFLQIFCRKYDCFKRLIKYLDNFFLKKISIFLKPITMKFLCKIYLKKFYH